MQRYRSTVFSLLLASGLCAQGSPLVIKTAMPEIAEDAADNFDLGALPELAEGQHWVLSLADDRTMSASAADGDVGVIRIEARPAQLCEVFADNMAEAQQMAQMFGGMAGAQAGLKPADLNKLIEGVFAFPRQLGMVTVAVTGSPQQGFVGKLTISPAADGWLAKLVAEIGAGGGAPILTGDSAMMAMAVDFDPAIMPKLMAPFMPLVVGAASGGDADKAKTMVAMMGKFIAAMDGGMAIILGEGGMSSLSVLRDAEALTELMKSKEYQDFSRGMAEMNPMADVEFDPAAATHRDVTLAKTVVDTGQPNPFSPDGVMETWSGVAGSYAISAQGKDAEREAKKLVDNALDNRIARKALAGGALLTVSMRLRELIESMSGGMMPVGDDAPSRVELALSKGGTDLVVDVKVSF